MALIVTGLSGAGKSLAVNALEDIGYFCIDNIPAKLMAQILSLAVQTENQLEKLAVVMDVRGARSSQVIEDALKALDEQEIDYQILFLDARDDVLERRYKETRRRHPISLSQGISTEDAIEAEREILHPLFARANYVVDTSLFSTAQHKEQIVKLFSGGKNKAMAISVVAFGFKFGLPKEADLVFDVRCLPNPFYIAELKEKTGLDQEVFDYVMQFEQSQELLRLYKQMLEYSIPLYEKEGKSQLTIAVGCTGGKHRSITFARLVEEICEGLGYEPVVQYRDVQRKT